MVDTSGVDWIEYFMPGTRAAQANAAANSGLAQVYAIQSAAYGAYLSAVSVPPGAIHPAQQAVVNLAHSVPTVGPPSR